MRSKIRLYWCARLVRGRRNLGDWLSPRLVRHLAGCDVEYARASRADMVAVGSVLHRVPTHWWNKSVDVWGTGLMHGDRPVRARHRYHAVRGKRTQDLLGMPEVRAWGDPGLLAPLLFPRFASVPKRWDVGLVPHHTDQSDPGGAALCERVAGVRVIDILSDVDDFLAEMAACRFVLSSSLHGLVIADAFQIPNAWVTMGDGLRGGAFKFADYYSVFGVPPCSTPIGDVNQDLIERVGAEYRRPSLGEIQQTLLRAFPRLRDGLVA